MHKYKHILGTVILSTLMLTGCNTASNAYPAATHSYNISGAAYKTAVDKIQRLSDLGRVSKADFALALALTADERVKAKVVDADLAAWEATRLEPAAYKADFKALQDAQAAVIVLANRQSL